MLGLFCRSIHIVSQVHALIVVPYASWCILHEKPEYSDNRAFGWNPEAGHLLAISSACVMIYLLKSVSLTKSRIGIFYGTLSTL